MYLDRRGIRVKRLKTNFPGWEWAHIFLKCHKQELFLDVLQNIKISRVTVTTMETGCYSKNLEKIKGKGT